MKLKTKSILKKVAIILGILIILLPIAVLCIDRYVVKSTKNNVLTLEQCTDIKDIDCIIVLGCGVNSDGKPSAMLEDRIIRGIELYKNGVSPKILMSGDHGTSSYDEVNVMKDYAVNCGVPSEDVFMDHAGFSTYESIYRAKYIFEAEKVLICTQGYHLYRALYIAESLGLEAYGCASDLRDYAGQSVRDIREVLARNKDVLMCITKPESTYMGDTIPVWGNGDVTND